MWKRVQPIFVGVLVLSPLLVALFAGPLGLDQDATWGTRRLLLLLGGLLVLGVVVVLRARRAAYTDSGSAALRWLWAARMPLSLAILTFVILLVYVFLATAGLWTRWPEVSRYYDRLADAFGHGQLDLDYAAPDALLAIPDPYEPAARNAIPGVKDFVDTVWDLAFFNGRFYLYWGPLPGLIVLLAKTIFGVPIPDQYLVFAFSAGTFACGTLLLVRLRNRLFPRTPLVLLLTGVALAGLGFPIPVLLSRPAVYEATIAGGQFFLIGGVLIAFMALDRGRLRIGMLVIASILWACAAASRTLMLVPAAFLTILTMVWTWYCRSSGESRATALASVVAIGSPLALCGIAIAWYNWARFGSVLETGLRYTLTFRNLNAAYGDTFSLAYLPSSLWLYLLSPAHVQPHFPFLVISDGGFPRWLSFGQSSLYHSEQVISLLLASPVVVFAIIGLLPILQESRNGPCQQRGTRGVLSSRSALRWLALALAGSSCLAFGAVLLYFNVHMRFVGEFSPALLLLTSIGMWEGYARVPVKHVLQCTYQFAAVALGLFSTLTSLAIAFSANYGIFQNNNRPLVRHLLSLVGQ